MISFHNPKFHEKILKKYGRKIRGSYFPNLFFKQDFESPVSGNNRIFIRIKLDFHNTILWKNFFFSFPEGKQQGNSAFPQKLKIPGLKKLDPTSEKPETHKAVYGNLGPKNFTYLKLINFELTAHKLTLLELINSRLTAYNLLRFKIINPGLTARDLQPATLTSLGPVTAKFMPYNPFPASFEFVTFTLLKPINPELKTHSFAPVNSIFANFKSLKLNYFEKNSKVPVSGTGKKILNKRSFENFISNRNSSFFIYSNPPSVPELIFRIMTGVLEKIFINTLEKKTRNQKSVPELNSYIMPGSGSSGLKEASVFNWLKIPTNNIITASQLNQQITCILGSKEAFQLNQQVTCPSGNKDVFQPDGRKAHKPGNAAFASHNQPAIKAANRKFIHVFNRLGGLLTTNKSTYRTGTYTINSPASSAREKNYPYRQTSHRKLWLQNMFKFKAAPVLASKAMLGGRETSYSLKTPMLFAYNNTATPKTEKPAVQAPACVTARIFNDYVALKLNLTEKYTLNYSTVNATGIKEAYAHIYPTTRTLNYAETCAFSYTLMHPAVLKTSSKVTHGTVYPANNYLTNNYPTDNYLTADHYKADDQRELKREQYPVQMNLLQTILNHPVFLKPLTTTAYALKHPKNRLPGSTENSTPNKTVTPTYGRKETSTLNSPEKHTLLFASICTFMQPVARAFNYVETLTYSYPAFMAVNYTANYPFNYSAARTHGLGTSPINYPIIYNHTQGTAKLPLTFSNNYHHEKRNYPAFPSLLFSFAGTEASTSFPDTGFFEHFRTVYTPSGIDAPVAPSYLITLRKPQNPVQADRSPSSRLSSGGLSSNELFSGRPVSGRFASSKLFDSSVLLLSRTENTNTGQKAIPFNLQRSKRMEPCLGIRKLQQISSGIILSARRKSAVGKTGKGLRSAPPLQKISEGREKISPGLLFRLKGLPGLGKTANSQPYSIPGNADFTFSGVSGAGKNPRTSGTEAFGKERSELMHAGGSTPETGRQELVYGESQNLFEEVKQIKEIVFETKEAVTDHLESHLPQGAGKTGQVMDIEQMSETVMRMIDRRLKIEAERRGIF